MVALATSIGAPAQAASGNGNQLRASSSRGFLRPARDGSRLLDGVAISEDGASFTDLIGLPNNNADQHVSGDPAITSIGDGVHFAVAGPCYPSAASCTDGLPASGTIALTIATVRHIRAATAGPASTS